MIPLRVRLALGLTLIGIATVAVGWYIAHSSETVPEQWTPVNASLAQAIDSLNAQASNTKTNDEPTLQPTTEPPSAQTVPSNDEAPAPASSPALTPAPASEFASALAFETVPASVPPSQTTESRLNLNDATLSQLEDLPGIGPSKAKAILAYREQHGGYRSIDQLLEVKGIGPKMLEKLLPELYVP